MKFVIKHLNSDMKMLKIQQNFQASLRQGMRRNMSYLNISETQEARKQKNKKEFKPHEYTTYSPFNDGPDFLLKEKMKKEKEEKTEMIAKGLNIMYKYLYVPVICLPMGLHFGFTFFDVAFVGKLTHYSLQNFLNHSFLVGCINTGILTGYKLNEERIDTQITSKELAQSYICLITSFAAVNTLAFCPMGYFAFNAVYLALIFSNYKLVKLLDKIIPNYSELLAKFLMATMVAMLFFANLHLRDYKKKVSEQGRFEDVVKFYELSSDREFKKVMTAFGEFLAEIDVKVEKSKE